MSPKRAPQAHRWKPRGDDGQPMCICTARCWKHRANPDEPCWGQMNVSEDYPGGCTHWCDGHGHFEDRSHYKPEPAINPELVERIRKAGFTVRLQEDEE